MMARTVYSKPKRSAEECRRILTEANEIYREAHTYDTDRRRVAALTLDSHDMWSLTQVGKILGVAAASVGRYISKSERTGGRFHPDTIGYALEEINLAEAGESNPLLTARIWDMGTAPSFLAKMIGQSVSTVQARAARGRALLHPDDA